MKYLSVCSGIEAASVAWHPLGWHPLAFSEIEPFPRAVLAHHYPDTPLHGDFTVLRDQPWIEDADILVGGTPCQAFSVAGLRNSLADDRGNLSLEYVRLADAIDNFRMAAGRQPAIIVWENVPGVLSVKDNAFGCFLAALAGDASPYVPPRGKWTDAGVVDGPQRAVAWRILDAQYFGLAQRRRRVFVVASAREGFDPAAVLLEFEGMRRDTPPRREAGQVAAQGVTDGVGKRSHWDGDFPHPTLNRGAKGTGGVGQSNQELFSQRGACLAPVVAARMVAFGEYSDDGTASTLKSRDYKDATDLIAQAFPDPAYALSAGSQGKGGVFGSGRDGQDTFIAHTLKGEGFDASEDGTGRGTPLGPVAGAICKDSFSGGAGGRPEGAAAGHFVPVTVPTLTSNGDAHCGFRDENGLVPVAYPLDLRIARNGRGDMGEIVNALNAQSGETGKGDAAPCVAFSIMPQNSGKDYKARPVEVAQPIMAGGPVGGNQGGDYIMQSMAVRRLTPVECERLQGFPDNYTMIPWKKKPADVCPDGPRYKALGNSMAVPCMRWIGERIASEIKEIPA